MKELKLKDGKLFRIEGDGRKLLFVMPKAMRKTLCVKFHDMQGHFSVDRTVARIKELYWFPQMKRYVKQHIQGCFECLLAKVPGGKKPGLLHSIPPGKRPFEVVHLDHVGPFVRSGRRNQWILVLIDNLTKFVKLYPVRDTSTKSVLRCLQSFITEFGLPDRVISDRGSCFTSHEFESFCQEKGVYHTLNSAHHPRANGQVERVNRTLIPTIITTVEDPNHKDWDLKIKEVESYLNAAYNASTGTSPFKMLHGYQPRVEDGLLRWLNKENEEWEQPENLHESGREAIQHKQEKSSEYFDKSHFAAQKLKVGDLVVMRCPPERTGEPTKTQARFRGPLFVTEVLPSDTYRVSEVKGTKKRIYATTAHITQLKLWKRPGGETSSDSSGC